MRGTSRIGAPNAKWGGAIRSATDLATLEAQLPLAGPRDVIELASGDYGNLNLNALFNPYLRYQGDYVTIKSAEGRGAVFETIALYDASYIRFDSITAQKTRAPGEDYKNKVIEVGGETVGSSHHIQFINSEIMGTDDDDYNNDTYGMWIRKVNDVLVQNNMFHDLDRAQLIFAGSRIDVKNNSYYDFKSDAMGFAGVHDTLIENNTGLNWHPDYNHAHPDFIQFWSNVGDGASSNITIRGNAMLPGTDAPTKLEAPQGIFIHDEAGLGHANFLIEENFIFTNAGWGIHFDAHTATSTGIVVRNNTVINDYIVGAAVNPPMPPNNASLAFRNNVVGEYYGNVATKFTFTGGAENSVTDLGGNVLVQHNDPTAANYFDKVFLAPFDMTYPASDIAEARAFLPIPGGIADGLGAQSRLEEFGVPTAWVQATTADSLLAAKTVMFHAADYTPGSVPTGPNVTFEWDFGDGSPVAYGRTVEHTFASFDGHAVTLTITDPDTSIDFTTVRTEVSVSPASVFVPFEQSSVNLGGSGTTGVWADPLLESYVTGDGGEGYAAEFNGTSGSRITFTLPDPAFVFVGREVLTVSFDFKLPSGSTGRAVWHGGSGFGFNIGPTGMNGYLATTGTAGKFIASGTLSSSLVDGNWHTASLTYDAATGTATTYLDGVELTSVPGFVGAISSTSGGTAAGQVYVGGYSSNVFTGQVDNVLVINGIVPPADMAAFMAQYGGA